MSKEIKSVLYAADLGPGCEEVLAYAIGVARQFGAWLQVVTVIEEEREKSLVEVDSHVPQAALDRYHDDRAKRVKEGIEAQIAAYYAERPDLEAGAKAIFEITVHEGDDVARRVLDEADAKQADLILIGSRGEGVLAGLLFGSVVHDLIGQTRTPVLLVPIRV
jgi:nucleotide-binding universal stress UspA family protein